MARAGTTWSRGSGTAPVSEATIPRGGSGGRGAEAAPSGSAGPRSARAGAAAGRDQETAATGSAVLRLDSRAARLGPLGLRQLVLVELSAAVLLVAWVVDPLLLIPATLVAAALVLLALLRRRNRSLPEWLGSVLALRRRQRRAATGLLAVGPQTDPRLAPVVECEPSLRTYGFTVRDHRTVGMVGDGTFLTAVLQIEPRSVGLRPRQALPLGPLVDALSGVDGIRLESVQIVQHTQPAPAPHLPEQSVAARNYQPLREWESAPSVRLTWVALRFDPELCAEEVAARGGGLDGAQRCLLRVADQLASRVTGAGFQATVLSEDQLLSAVATSLCAHPMATAQAGRADRPARRTRESARTWRCDDRRHTTFWVARWPQLGAGGVSLPQLVAPLTSVPALATTFSLTLRGRGRREVSVAGHLRVTGRSDRELESARRALLETANGLRTNLVRLDREQLPGLLATLPLGGAH
ncbi:type VII secretion protein EccE [Streptomyces sp. TP-A0874]|uniref:type VII secretion protein EccE n=1 Tax=Streptomyces sp. TP-A0874 TaxID=549819 RepID=UPI00099F4B4B|nr:type VII secretion protein EccE [Streptomyces sp. TP-A0874]